MWEWKKDWTFIGRTNLNDEAGSQDVQKSQLGMAIIIIIIIWYMDDILKSDALA